MRVGITCAKLGLLVALIHLGSANLIRADQLSAEEAITRADLDFQHADLFKTEADSQYSELIFRIDELSGRFQAVQAQMSVADRDAADEALFDAELEAIGVDGCIDTGNDLMDSGHVNYGWAVKWFSMHEWGLAEQSANWASDDYFRGAGTQNAVYWYLEAVSGANAGHADCDNAEQIIQMYEMP